MALKINISSSFSSGDLERCAGSTGSSSNLIDIARGNRSQSKRSSAHRGRSQSDDDLEDLVEGRGTANQPEILSFPIVRTGVLGQGSSSTVYKSIILKTLAVTAEKVFIISDPHKRQQLFRELETLKSVVDDDDASHHLDLDSSSGHAIHKLRSQSESEMSGEDVISDIDSCNSRSTPLNDSGNASNLLKGSFRHRSGSVGYVDAMDKKNRKGIGCPFIVPMLEVFSNPADGTLSLCLEYMNGGSLQDIVNSGGCSNEIVLSSIAYQMLSGLQFLHEQRLIHRDVKPSNALLSTNGRVKLTDFGLARSLEHGRSLAESFVGTFMYMAPERLTGEPYSFKSDIWSLGVTVFTVLLGRYPYPMVNKGYWELLNATQEGPPPMPEDLELSGSIKHFFTLTCAKAIEERLPADLLLQHPFLSEKLDLIPSEFIAVTVQAASHQNTDTSSSNTSMIPNSAQHNPLRAAAFAVLQAGGDSDSDFDKTSLRGKASSSPPAVHDSSVRPVPPISKRDPAYSSNHVFDVNEHVIQSAGPNGNGTTNKLAAATGVVGSQRKLKATVSTAIRKNEHNEVDGGSRNNSPYRLRPRGSSNSLHVQAHNGSVRSRTNDHLALESVNSTPRATLAGDEKALSDERKAKNIIMSDEMPKTSHNTPTKHGQGKRTARQKEGVIVPKPLQLKGTPAESDQAAIHRRSFSRGSTDSSIESKDLSASDPKTLRELKLRSKDFEMASSEASDVHLPAHIDQSKGAIEDHFHHKSKRVNRRMSHGAIEKDASTGESFVKLPDALNKSNHSNDGSTKVEQQLHLLKRKHTFNNSSNNNLIALRHQGKVDSGSGTEKSRDSFPRRNRLYRKPSVSISPVRGVDDALPRLALYEHSEKEEDPIPTKQQTKPLDTKRFCYLHTDTIVSDLSKVRKVEGGKVAKNILSDEDLGHLVETWKRYVLESNNFRVSRQREAIMSRESSDHKSVEQDDSIDNNFAIQGSSSTSPRGGASTAQKLRRIINRQQQQNENGLNFLVTQETVTNLSQMLGCKEALLIEKFQHAILDIQRENSSAVEVLKGSKGNRQSRRGSGKHPAPIPTGPQSISAPEKHNSYSSKGIADLSGSDHGTDQEIQDFEIIGGNGSTGVSPRTGDMQMTGPDVPLDISAIARRHEISSAAETQRFKLPFMPVSFDNTGRANAEKMKRLNELESKLPRHERKGSDHTSSSDTAPHKIGSFDDYDQYLVTHEDLSNEDVFADGSRRLSANSGSSRNSRGSNSLNESNESLDSCISLDAQSLRELLVKARNMKDAPASESIEVGAKNVPHKENKSTTPPQVPMLHLPHHENAQGRADHMSHLVVYAESLNLYKSEDEYHSMATDAARSPTAPSASNVSSTSSKNSDSFICRTQSEDVTASGSKKKTLLLGDYQFASALQLPIPESPMRFPSQRDSPLTTPPAYLEHLQSTPLPRSSSNNNVMLAAKSKSEYFDSNQSHVRQDVERNTKVWGDNRHAMDCSLVPEATLGKSKGRPQRATKNSVENSMYAVHVKVVTDEDVNCSAEEVEDGDPLQRTSYSSASHSSARLSEEIEDDIQCLPDSPAAPAIRLTRKRSSSEGKLRRNQQEFFAAFGLPQPAAATAAEAAEIPEDVELPHALARVKQMNGSFSLSETKLTDGRRASNPAISMQSKMVFQHQQDSADVDGHDYYSISEPAKRTIKGFSGMMMRTSVSENSDSDDADSQQYFEESFEDFHD